MWSTGRKNSWPPLTGQTQAIPRWHTNLTQQTGRGDNGKGGRPAAAAYFKIQGRSVSLSACERDDAPVVAMVSVHAQWVATHRILLQLPLVCFLPPAAGPEQQVRLACLLLFDAATSNLHNLRAHQLLPCLQSGKANESINLQLMPTSALLSGGDATTAQHTELRLATSCGLCSCALHEAVGTPKTCCSATHAGSLDCPDVGIHSTSLSGTLPCSGST